MSNLSPVQRGSIGALVLAGAIGAVVYIVVLRRGQPPPRKRFDPSEQGGEDHGKELDNGLSPLLAMADSPEAKTPCETSYNSILAGQKAAKAAGIDPIFVYIAPHDDFIAKCEALPEKTQWCMTPRYSAKNRDECTTWRPSDAVLDAMRKVRPQEEQFKPGPMSSAPVIPSPAPAPSPSVSGAPSASQK